MAERVSRSTEPALANNTSLFLRPGESNTSSSVANIESSHEFEAALLHAIDKSVAKYVESNGTKSADGKSPQDPRLLQTRIVVLNSVLTELSRRLDVMKQRISDKDARIAKLETDRDEAIASAKMLEEKNTFLILENKRLEQESTQLNSKLITVMSESRDVQQNTTKSAFSLQSLRGSLVSQLSPATTIENLKASTDSLGDSRRVSFAIARKPATAVRMSRLSSAKITRPTRSAIVRKARMIAAQQYKLLPPPHPFSLKSKGLLRKDQSAKKQRNRRNIPIARPSNTFGHLTFTSDLKSVYHRYTAILHSQAENLLSAGTENEYFTLLNQNLAELVETIRETLNLLSEEQLVSERLRRRCDTTQHQVEVLSEDAAAASKTAEVSPEYLRQNVVPMINSVMGRRKKIRIKFAKAQNEKMNEPKVEESGAIPDRVEGKESIVQPAISQSSMMLVNDLLKRIEIKSAELNTLWDNKKDEGKKSSGGNGHDNRAYKVANVTEPVIFDNGTTDEKTFVQPKPFLKNRLIPNSRLHR